MASRKCGKDGLCQRNDYCTGQCQHTGKLRIIINNSPCSSCRICISSWESFPKSPVQYPWYVSEREYGRMLGGKYSLASRWRGSALCSKKTTRCNLSPTVTTLELLLCLETVLVEHCPLSARKHEADACWLLSCAATPGSPSLILHCPVLFCIDRLLCFTLHLPDVHCLLCIDQWAEKACHGFAIHHH